MNTPGKRPKLPPRQGGREVIELVDPGEPTYRVEVPPAKTVIPARSAPNTRGLSVPPTAGGTGGSGVVHKDLGEPTYLIPVSPAKTVVSARTSRPVDDPPPAAPATPSTPPPGPS